MSSEVPITAPMEGGVQEEVIDGKRLPAPILVATGLLVTLLVVYGPVFVEWVRDWIRDDNYTHGFLIPPISAFIVWRKRQELLDTPAAPSWWGALFLVLSCALLVLGTAGAEVFTQRVSFLGVLGALVVLHLGWRHLGKVLFPIAFLFLAIPLPYVIYYGLTLPMQLLATKLAILGLQPIGVPAWASGNIIMLAGIELEIAEACSGIRSLYAFLALGALAAWSTPVGVWLRVLIFLTAIPLSIAGNAVRVWLTGVAVHVTRSPAAAEGHVHEFFGMVTMTAALLVFLVLRMLVNRIWGREAAARDESSGAAEGPGARSDFRNRPLVRGLPVVRMLFAGLLLIASGGFAENLRTAQTRAGTIPPLAALPRDPCELQSVDVAIDAVSAEVLDADTLLYRKYYRHDAPFADLLVAYFDEQRVNSQIHSPRNCMPGSGWRIAAIEKREIQVAGQPRPVTHMLIKRDREERHVYYWFLTQKDWTASEYRLKWHLIVCALGDRPTNAAFVRVDAETSERCMQLIDCLDGPMREILDGTGLYGTTLSAAGVSPGAVRPSQTEAAGP